MDQEKNEAIIQQYFDHFNKHEWKQMAELYAPNADFKDPALGKGIVKQTPEQIIEKYTALQQIFPDIHDEIVKIYPSTNEFITVEFISKGTAADGTLLELPICTIFTIKDGKIVADFTYYDNFDEQAD